MSKKIVEGKIENVYTKELDSPDNYGNQYAVTVKIDGSLYGMGRKKKPSVSVKLPDGTWHKLSEGDHIEAVCDVVQKGDRVYNNIKATDVTLKQASGNAPSGNSGAPASAPVSTPSPAKTDDRQDAIMRQSAMGYAAQLVAGTLTGKSDLDKAAAEVVRLANDYLVPYAKYGVTEDETRKAEEKELQNQQAHQQSEDDGEPFNDDVPF